MLIVFSFISTSMAELPLPIFPECGEADAQELCPNDADDWSFLSYIEVIHIFFLGFYCLTYFIPIFIHFLMRRRQHRVGRMRFAIRTAPLS